MGHEGCIIYAVSGRILRFFSLHLHVDPFWYLNVYVSLVTPFFMPYLILHLSPITNLQIFFRSLHMSQCLRHPNIKQFLFLDLKHAQNFLLLRVRLLSYSVYLSNMKSCTLFSFKSNHKLLSLACNLAHAPFEFHLDWWKVIALPLITYRCSCSHYIKFSPINLCHKSVYFTTSVALLLTSIHNSTNYKIAPYGPISINFYHTIAFIYAFLSAS